MDYINLIQKLVGKENLEKIKSIKEENCKLSYKNNKGNIDEYNYKVYDDENIGFGYYIYNVNILLNGNIIDKMTCTCHDYYVNKKCKHIAAVLFYNQKLFFNNDINQVSYSFLKKFSTPKNEFDRKKLKIELSFKFIDNNIKWSLKVGYDKLYNLNKTKLLDFINAYYNDKEVLLGTYFTYSNEKYYISDNEMNLLDYLFSYKSNTDPFILTYREFIALTEYLNNMNFYIENIGYFNKVEYKIPTNLILEYKDNNYNLYLKDFHKYIFIDTNSNFIGLNNTLYVIPTRYQKLISNIKFTLLDKITFNENNFLLFKEGLYKKTKDIIVIDDYCTKKLLIKPIVNIFLDIIKNKIICNIKFNYVNKEYSFFSNEDLELRDKSYETEVIKSIVKDKFIIEKDYLAINDINLIGDFLSNDLKELVTKYKVYTSKKIEDIKIIKKSNINSNFKLGTTGMLEYNFNIDNINIDELTDMLKNLRNKKKYYRLRNGNLINLYENKEINDFNNILETLGYLDLKEDNILMPNYKIFYLNSLKNNNNLVRYDDNLNLFINNFKEYKNANIEFTKDDNTNLRDYQKLGVKWLYTIYKCNLGGILADEMGLGKTYQAICFIKEVIKENKNSKILIVTPTSLVYNWVVEFNKFAKDINFICVYDNKKKRKEIINDFSKYNVFITSYGLIKNDNDEYEDKLFDLCLIDEAQSIKNYYTELSIELKKIKAKVKIALTGTPIENNIMELWNIFDFIMPGYLENKKSFYNKFNNLNSISNLRHLIEPFILRRKKNEVSKDLPDKIEKIIYLELTDMQKVLYLKLLNDTKLNINNEIKLNGFNNSKIKILSLLMRLRQICIDPKIVYDNYTGNQVKLEKLLELVEGLKKDNHKILIFSSFKTVIDNVSNLLNINNITNYKITGDIKSKERIDLVNKFNSDDTTCFLITLKSGGTGLNLTSADIVIHLDMWWNPQVENQATDRAHRIGQNKKVTVLKLVTKGTLEEKIITLQEQKKILSDSLIEGIDNSTLFNLNEDDIKELLTYND